MKFAWRSDTHDYAAWNDQQVEQVDLDEFENLLTADLMEAGLDMDL
jgi:hypothetical protein